MKSAELTKRIYVSFSESEYKALGDEIAATAAQNGKRSYSAVVRDLALQQLKGKQDNK